MHMVQCNNHFLLSLSHQLWQKSQGDVSVMINVIVFLKDCYAFYRQMEVFIYNLNRLKTYFEDGN